MNFHGLLIATALLAGTALGLGCGSGADDPSLYGEIPFDPTRPTVGGTPAVTPYTGVNPQVLEAQAVLRTGLDLHAKVIYRTCSPNGGVCHHAKEYPDLHTPANFGAAIDAPCNVQSGTPEAVYDRCERPGDRVTLQGSKPVEIGYIRVIPGEYNANDDDAPPLDDETPGLHIYLSEPIAVDWNCPENGDCNRNGNAEFIRNFVHEGIVQEIAFSQFNSRWYKLGDGSHIMARVSTNAATAVQELLNVGIVEGDQNKNGVYGARTGEPIKLIDPGNPEESYLVARLRGVMLDEEIPGSRMPLANQPLTVPEMLALFCYIEGLGKVPVGEYNLAAPIDYAACSYSANPDELNLLGSGVTWASRVKNVLEFNCGGCHSGEEPQAALNLLEGDVYTRLLEPSAQMTEMTLIDPGSPETSYLWLKLQGDEGTILGTGMPFNPLTGEGRLKQSELDDIEAWILAGAVENE